MTRPELIVAAANARTIADVERIEVELVKQFGLRHERYLGDNEANWSEVSASVDPRVVLFERTVNMWDAILEMLAQRRQDFGAGSPSEAAFRFLGVPLGGPAEMNQTERKRIAELCTMTLHDSDDSLKRPTIGSRDYGIGIATREMPETILSLVRSNKLRKPYLHGVFGKGGSVACMFSMATVIISRKQPDLLVDGEEDRVSLAVVRQGDRDDVGLPFFRYLVGPDDRLPYSVPASETDFEPGTLVLHIGYQAERLGRENWNQDSSIYAFAETLLFRPTLPWQLHDARSGHANQRPASRRAEPAVVMGLGQRLDASADSDDLLDASRAASLDIPGVGQVTARYWLFETEGQVRSRAARGHTAVFTTGGHVHHVWSRQHFKTLVPRRPRVADRIIVEIDTSLVPQKQRVQIFTSFRDALLKSDKGAALEQGVIDWLSKNVSLEEAERTLTRRSFQAAGSSISAAFQRRLNRAFRAKLPGIITTGRDDTPPPPPRPPEELYPEPTTFTGPEEIHVLPGVRKTVYMQCNAVDGFVPDNAEIEITASSGSTPSTGIGELRRGRLQISLLFEAATPLGDSGLEIGLSFLRSAGGYTTLSWPITVHVVSELPRREPRTRGKNHKRLDERGDIAFIWKKQEGWDDKVVGELQDVPGEILAETNPAVYGELAGVTKAIPTVVLNDHYGELRAYLNQVAYRGDAAVDNRRDRYGLAVGVAVANLYFREQEIQDKHTAWSHQGNGGDEPTKPMNDEQKRRALVHAARGVIALLPDFDELAGEEATGDERELVGA